MKKNITLPALALVGGLAGFVLRRWQLSSAFDPDSGLFAHGSPATYGLMVVTTLIIALIAVLLRGPVAAPKDFLSAFGCPQAGQMTILAASGLLFIVAGLLGLREGLELLQLWKISPDRIQVTYPAARLLTAALCLPTGGEVLLMGRGGYRGQMPATMVCLAPVPALVGLVWLFATHLENGVSPILMKYGFSLSAAAALMLAHYYVAGFFFGRQRPRPCLFWALTGVVLGLISLADGLTLAVTVLTVAFVLSSLGSSFALLGNCFASSQIQRPVNEDNRTI